jgi:hypothetical protein
MAISQSFEGVRFSIKVDLQTLAHLEKEAAGSARERVARDWLNNWRTLAGLSPFLFQRLVYAAQKRRMPITSLVNEALTKYCTDLPPVPEGVEVQTTIDVLGDEPAEAPKAAKPEKHSLKSRK